MRGGSAVRCTVQDDEVSLVGLLHSLKQACRLKLSIAIEHDDTLTSDKHITDTAAQS